MTTTICTFNANNLFVRYRFGQTFPGDMAGKSAVTDPASGYLPMYNPALFELYNPSQRALTAKALSRDNSAALPDVLCLQEIESLIALRKFNEDHLGSYYKRALLIDSRDFRQIDVAVLTNLDILSVRTHVDDRDPQAVNPEWPFMFSRDCLEVEVLLPAARRLTLFVNHLKSKFVDSVNMTPAETAAAEKACGEYRGRQAQAVIGLVHDRFPGQAFNKELFAVVGDLNDTPNSDPLIGLCQNAGLEDALLRFPLEQDRWTNWYRGKNSVSQLDAMLLSPALAAATAGTMPYVERRGISFDRTLSDGGPGPRQAHFYRKDGDPDPIDVDFRFQRLPGVGIKEYASDHCPVFLEIP